MKSFIASVILTLALASASARAVIPEVKFDSFSGEPFATLAGERTLNKFHAYFTCLDRAKTEAARKSC